MNVFILIDVVMVLVLISGFLKGYKHGFAISVTPLLSFMCGLFTMKPIGKILYAIFGEALEETIQKLIIIKISNPRVSTLVLNQLTFEDMVRNFLELISFIIVFLVITLIVNMLFDVTELHINNSIINNTDKLLGGISGLLFECCLAFLILTTTKIICYYGYDFRVSEVITKALDGTYITQFLYNINPVSFILFK